MKNAKIKKNMKKHEKTPSRTPGSSQKHFQYIP